MKAFHELNEAFPSLLDESGRRKPFERFLNDVRAIDSAYNANYLRAEYNFVAASAEMAARWEGFVEDGDRYNLQYRATKDGRTRPEHAALDGVTLPVSDPMWAEKTMPSLFGDAPRSRAKRSRRERHEDYEAFVDKFRPKLTTDDCLTPPEVYEAVIDWISANVRDLDGVEVVRPFWPGGDYERHDYPPGCVVIDNPPFSKLAKIRRFYTARGVNYFLFAPAMTLFSSEASPGETFIVASSIFIITTNR